MRLGGKVLVTLLAVSDTKRGEKKGQKVRTPNIRAARNIRYLTQWFDNNCNDEVRPTRCENWRRRFFEQWSKMQKAFDSKCGFFDNNIPNGGPRPSSRRRRRQTDDEEEEEDESLFIIDWDEGEESETEEVGESGAEVAVDFGDYNDYLDDPFYLDDDEYELDSTTDEDSGQRRTEEDLMQQEARQISSKPDRALKQLTNGMKQGHLGSNELNPTSTRMDQLFDPFT
jgi:hypothetical protein